MLCVPARGRRKRLSSRSRCLVEGHSSFPLQVWSFDTANLVILGETNPHSSSRRTVTARSRRLRGSIDSTHIRTHIHYALRRGQNDRWRQFVSLSDEIPRTWFTADVEDFLRSRRTEKLLFPSYISYIQWGQEKGENKSKRFAREILISLRIDYRCKKRSISTDLHPKISIVWIINIYIISELMLRYQSFLSIVRRSSSRTRS